ncbi:MAG TPA: HU family DNA-binding protein [Thermodesulfovibrionia bacterium]|nr:HU family DNA-binding protein [Thermodesulfovibrionia bacterium]
MKKADIISRMAEGADITKAQADKALENLLEAITEGLKDGGRVAFVGFGTFSVLERKARTGRNPKTGEVIQIAESRTVKFTPSEGLKKAFN